jgi:L-amino acid N-acyltransferase YncA
MQVRDAAEADLPAIFAIDDHATGTTTADLVAELRDGGCKFGRWLDLTFVQAVLDMPLAPAEG